MLLFSNAPEVLSYAYLKNSFYVIGGVFLLVTAGLAVAARQVR